MEAHRLLELALLVDQAVALELTPLVAQVQLVKVTLVVGEMVVGVEAAVVARLELVEMGRVILVVMVALD